MTRYHVSALTLLGPFRRTRQDLVLVALKRKDRLSFDLQAACCPFSGVLADSHLWLHTLCLLQTPYLIGWDPFPCMPARQLGMDLCLTTSARQGLLPS